MSRRAVAVGAVTALLAGGVVLAVAPGLLDLHGTFPMAQAVALRGGVAVALNGEVVPRSRWGEASLAAGDELEVVGARQGG